MISVKSSEVYDRGESRDTSRSLVFTVLSFMFCIENLGSILMESGVALVSR